MWSNIISEIEVFVLFGFFYFEEYFVIPSLWQIQSFQNGVRYSCLQSSWFVLLPEVMQRIRWDSAEQHLRDPACIVHSGL